MISIKVQALLLALAAATAPSAHSASVVDFESVVSGTSVSSYLEDGYWLVRAGTGFAHILGTSGQGGTDFSGNGTNRLISFNSNQISVSSADGSLFRLDGFDGGESWVQSPHGWATHIQVQGVLADNSIITQLFLLDLLKSPTAGMQTFDSDAAFNNLKAVIFSGIGGNPEFSLDNIRVSAVPLPAAAWLFGSALLGLFGMSRKNRQGPAKA